jgi:hypothetical protein
MAQRGIDAFLEILHGAGLQYIFGNPGTTELPLNDALLGDERFQYILGLQEVPVMAIADGYAMASGKVGVVNLHISPGLGHAMGLLYKRQPRGNTAVGHRGPTRPATAIRRTNSRQRHGQRRAAVVQVGQRSSAGRGPALCPAPRPTDRHDAADGPGVFVVAAGCATGKRRTRHAA